MTASPESKRLSVDLEEEGRYHRQTLISWWEQDRLREASVLVVGAGALGNELIKNLALLGVGTIVVIDLDRVENSNLSRCVMFREEDEGRPKAEVVATAARQLNPEVRVVPVVGDVRVDLGLRVFHEVDLVLGGLDNREARLHVNQACWKTTTPWIDGAIEGLMGVMRVFVPPASACYECTMMARDHELLAARRACSLLTRDQMLEGKVPTTATSASVIAALQVQEAVKLLHRDTGGFPLDGRGFAFNGLTHDSYVVTYARRDDCMSHDTYDLTVAETVASDATFGELLALAEVRLGAGAVLDLEHELVPFLACASCQHRRRVDLPIERLTTADANCVECGSTCTPELLHVIDRTCDELLQRRPDDIGLPRDDIITARAGTRRHHFLIGGDTPALVRLLANT